MKSLLLALPLVALVTSTSWGQSPPEPAIAKVNGVVIPKRVFDQELDKIVSRGGQIPPDRVARIADNIVKRLVEEELIGQAVKRARIVVPQVDIDQGMREYRDRFQSEEQYQSYLKNGGVSIDAIIKRIRDRRGLELLLASRMTVTREESRAFYDDNVRFYTEKAGIRASHILFKLAEEATADELSAVNQRVREAQAALAAGEDFSAVAKRMTEGPSEDGDLGWFSEGRMVKEFEDVAFKLRVGEVSGPVRTRFGIHIIKLVDRREDRLKTFEEVEPAIIASLQNKKFFTERRLLLTELEKSAQIETFIPLEYQVPAAPEPMGEMEE